MLDPCSKDAGTARLWGVATDAGLRATVVEPQAVSRQTRQHTNASDFSRTLYAFQSYKTFLYCPSKRRPAWNSVLCPKSAITMESLMYLLREVEQGEEGCGRRIFRPIPGQNHR